MKKIILFLNLIFLSFNTIAQTLAPYISPRVALQPLCFQDRKTCNMAAEILSLPPYGNFRLGSKCRDKTPAEIHNKICYGYNGVLGLEAFIELPFLKQFQWRNQCYSNIFLCNNAAQIWRQLGHPRFSFSVVCGQFLRGMWMMPDQEMREKGINICNAIDPVELRVKVTRER